MADMEQYPALVDLELVVKELAKTTGRPVAIVYDPRGGWCLSDEVRKGASKHGAECPEYGVQTYQDWFSRTIGEAALVAFGIRFLPGTLLGRLFKKPVTGQGSEARGAGSTSTQQQTNNDRRQQPSQPARQTPNAQQRTQANSNGAVRNALPLPKASRPPSGKGTASSAPQEAGYRRPSQAAAQDQGRQQVRDGGGRGSPATPRPGGYRGPGNRG
jgi:hypothetical protein